MHTLVVALGECVPLELLCGLLCHGLLACHGSPRARLEPPARTGGPGIQEASARQVGAVGLAFHRPV